MPRACIGSEEQPPLHLGERTVKQCRGECSLNTLIGRQEV